MDEPVLFLLLYFEFLFNFFGLWFPSNELHHHLPHNLLNYSKTPSGSCDSGRPAPSRIWWELLQGALNQRRRAGMISHAAQFRGYSSSVGSKRGESDSVPVNTFHVAAI